MLIGVLLFGILCVYPYPKPKAGNLSTANSRVPGWVVLKPGRNTPYRGRLPLRMELRLSEKDMAFIDEQAMNMEYQLGRKVSRQEMIRECIAIVAWEKFDIDLD